MASKLIDHNPLLKKPVLTALSILHEQGGMDRAALEAAAQQQWSEQCRQNVPAIIDTVVRAHLATETLFVDGAPYEGTLEDMQTDTSLEEGVEVSSTISLAQAGCDVLVDYAPDATLAALVAERPQYHDAYLAVLSACAADGGATRDALEATLNELPALAIDHETKQRSVYPQYFIDALEAAGGIEWSGLWRTTPAGKTLIDA